MITGPIFTYDACMVKENAASYYANQIIKNTKASIRMGITGTMHTTLTASLEAMLSIHTCHLAIK